MDFLLEFLDHAIGPETELVELLPLAVLLVIVVGLHYIRGLLLKLFGEIGALRERIDLAAEIRRIADQQAPGSPGASMGEK